MKNPFAIFIEGFLFFFGFVANPLKETFEAIHQRSDADSLLNDWYNVGNDIRKAYETGKEIAIC